MEIFKRSWRLSVEIDGVIKTWQEIQPNDESLSIEFDISNAVFGVFAEGSITIKNLSSDDMTYLATSFSPINGKFKRNKVSLEAGYNGELGIILGGNIIGCEANFASVDKSVNLRVQGGIKNNLLKNNIQTSLAGNIDFKAVCNECAKKNDLTLRYDKEIKPKTLSDFSFNGSPFQMIERLRTYLPDLNIFISEDGKTLNVLKKEQGEKINEQELSCDTGLIGKIQPSERGYKIRSFLNTNFKAGGFVKIKNSYLKQFDGVYRILELKHRGANRGEAWDTELLAVKRK